MSVRKTKLNNNVCVVCYDNTDYIKQDEYLRQQYIRMARSLNKMFRFIDSKDNISVFNTNEGNVRLSFMVSVLMNVFYRFGFFELDRDIFLKMMQKVYDDHFKMTGTTKEQAKTMGFK